MKTYFPFVYQATVIWTESEPDFKLHHYRIAGVGFCKDFADAMKQIEKREGDTLESIEYLELFEETNTKILDIPTSWVKPLVITDPIKYLEPIKEGDT